MAGYIPKEHTETYRRWQADSFDTPTPAAVQPASLPAAEAVPAGVADDDQAGGADSGEIVTGFALPTAEDVERMHNEARAAGFE